MNRILLVCHGYPFETIGGVGQVMLRLVETLPSLGWSVHVLVPQNTRGYRKPKVERREQPWGTLHILHRSMMRWSSAWLDRRGDEEIIKLLKIEHIQYIHVHHLNGLPLQWLTHLSEIILHITLHDYAIPCARGQLLNRNRLICTGPSIDNCLTCIEPWLVLESSDNVLYNRMTLTQRIMMSAQKIDAPSRDLCHRMSTLYPGIQIDVCQLPMRESDTIPPPTDTSDHQLIFVGSIHPSKGLHILLQAMHRLRHTPFQLTIIGGPTDCDLNPEYACTWLDLAEGLPNVSYLGPCSHNDLLNAVASAQCLILPSIWPENSPLVIREALQHGLHVICGEGGSAELSDSITQVRPLSVYNLTQAIRSIPTRSSPPQKYPDPQVVIEHWVQISSTGWG